MNKIFDTLKYVAVIFLSDITQYGYLVILSVIAVFISYIFFISYVVMTSIKKPTIKSNNTQEYTQVPLEEMKNMNEKKKDDDIIPNTELLSANLSSSKLNKS